ETLTESDLMRAQILGNNSVVAIMQALAAQNWDAPPQLWVVTGGAQPVTDDTVAIAQAPVWGLGRSIALEQPEHWGGLIDLEAGVAPDLAALIEAIANATDENQIAWRGGQRYVARLARVEAAPTQPQPIPLHAAGTYLITGGLGSLGLRVARWMVEQGARRLVLLGRSALPDRASWDELPHDHPASDQIAALHELERLGATVVVAQADAADQSQMQALFAELQRTLPAIRGIVHAAGVAQPTPLAELDPATLAAVLRPKVEGAWLLHELSRQLPLDFFVCFSSIAAVWGSRELAHYAAANQFLDALVHLRRGQGLPALSINWGPWAERGMAATAERNRALKLTGLNPLPAEQALTALSYAMQSPAAQQIVVDADWTTFTALYGVKSSARFFEQIQNRTPEQIVQVAVSSDQRDQLLSLPPTERRAQLLDDLRRQVAGVLRLEPARLDVEQPLNTLGLDSLMAVELKNGIEASLRVSLPMVTFLQGPSIAQLTDEILDRLGDAAPIAASAPPKLVAAHDASPEQPLSLGQRALWFLHQLAPDSTAYNIVGASKIRSVIDLHALWRVFQRLVDRHPSLRTTFTAPSGTPIQVIHQRMDAFFQAEDASAWTESELNARLVEEAHRPFDLEAGPLFRAYLFTRAPEEHVLLLAVHHTIADFWSLVVLINEVGVLYPAEIAGTGAALAPLDVTYADYARWQAEMLRGAEGARLWSYWSQQLAGDLPFLNLPTDKPRPAVQTYRGASQTLVIDAALTQQLKAVCEDHRTTLYTALMAAWHALLHRYTGQPDILVGSPIAGRNWAEVAGVVGYFVSPVVIRGSFADNPSFGALLDQMRQTVLDALEHHQYPLALLAERLKPVRDPSRSPLFQAMFILQKAQLLNDQGLTPFVLRETGAQMDLGGLTLESLALEQRVAQFDLTLVMVEANGGLAASLEYNTDLFEAATIERMLGHFRTLLAAMVAQPAQPIVALPLLCLAERALLDEWNATALSYSRTQRLHELFEAQVERTPDAIAVIFEDQQLTYAELDRRANQLAHHLQARGVGPDRLVGVCVERSPEMVIALLAVLKAGGAYVPLDPNYPSERIRYVLEDSRAALLLTQASLLEGLQIEDYRHDFQLLCLDRDWPTIAQASEQPPTCAANTEDLAYVIYTSGSLGRPKGVQIPHRAVVNFLSAMQREPGISAHDTLLSVTTLSFDIAGLEIFLPLSVGARLIVASRELAADGQRLSRLLDATATTVMQATPATWRLLIESGWQGSPNLRILCG
ncbi:MAG: SDR family NAD(P)-dependent oxidoreductase, partial [Chloroflexi bacterium]|nr:SDR family NAD(P)-dependent oxidoreductase [Chloroflexota bacterium]